jgi:hypothetical protein
MNMIKNRTVIHREIFRYCLLGIAILLPIYGPIVPSVIVLMVLNWVIEGRFRHKFHALLAERSRRLTLAFGLIYILYIAGLLHTFNFDYGLFDLEVKLSLLIFPLVFSTSDIESFSAKRRQELLLFFVLGCLAGSLLLIGRAFVATIFDRESDAFFYGSLSWYFHSSYLSMYYNFAIVVIFDHLISANWKKNINRRLAESGLILWFLFLVFLLSSKAGFLSLGGILLFFSGILVFQHKNWLGGILILTLGTLIFTSMYELIPGPLQRLENAGKVVRSESGTLSHSSESTAERLSIWEVSTEIIKEHYLIGVGTGDVKDELLTKYSQKGMGTALDKKLNVHCQYLQTFVALGIAGFVVLVLMLVLPGIMSIRRNDIIYLLFLAIFAFNILVESMFETQAGVVFYAFFNAFLFISMTSNRRDITCDVLR